MDGDLDAALTLQASLAKLSRGYFRSQREVRSAWRGRVVVGARYSYQFLSMVSHSKIESGGRLCQNSVPRNGIEAQDGVL
jgi:hypothetical protein